MDAIWQLDSLDWTIEELLDPSRDPAFSLFFDKNQPWATSTSDVNPDSTDLVVPNPDPTEDAALVSSPTPSADTTATDISRAMLEHWLKQSLASSSSDETTPSAGSASPNDLGHPLCSISPEVAPLVSVNVMYHVYKQYNCLPTRISPVDYDTSLQTYCIELPSASSSSALRVVVSWPTIKHHTLGGQNWFATKSSSIPSTLHYEQPLSTNVKAYLRNNFQLRRMGLAYPSPVQKQGTSAPINDIMLAPFDVWPSAIHSVTPSDKITSEGTEHNCRAWAAIRCIKPRDQFSSSTMSERTKEPSDNVPLFLSQKETDSGKGLERFEPTLLMKRFERWREVQDEQHLPDDFDADPGALDLEEDLRLLEEEGEFLFRNEMDLEDYKSLCARHDLQRMLKTTSGEGRAVDDIMDQFLRIEYDDVPTTSTSCDDQAALFVDTGTKDKLLTGQGPVMELPRIVGWTVLNADVLSSTTMEPVRAVVDPDFVLEQDMADSSGMTARGTLKQIWPRLDGVQQGRLLGLLTRMLVAIWDNFDILDDNQRDDSTIHQGQRLMSTKADTYLHDQEEIHCQTRPGGAGPWAKQDLVEQTAAVSMSQRQSAEDRLRLLENDFMNRSFLDVVREVTKPVQSQSVGHGGHDANGLLSRSSKDLPTAHTTISDRSLAECAHPPWDLDDIDTVQRMTTTRATAKESHFAQDRTFMLPLRPDNTLECGSARSFDFSLDDLLIQVDVHKESALSSPLLQNLKVIGVSRWKTIGPRPPSTPLIPPPKDLLPRSSNVFQTMAKGSLYPLVHLFSLPDVFCPVQFGGQEEEKEEQEGLAHVLARSLAKQRPLAAEFLTEEVEDKERRMYHRWMAAWHERSSRAPKATRTRYEMMKILREHYQEGRGLFDNAQGNDDNNCRGGRDYYYDQVGGRGRGRENERDNSIPQARSRQLPPQQQPENKERADFTTAPSSARCSRCRDEWNEQERTRQEKEQFHEACQVWDKLEVVDDDHLQRRDGQQQRQRQEYGYGQKRIIDDVQQTRWDQVGKEALALGGLGLSNAQQHSLTQLLDLGLGLGLGLGNVSFADGVGMGKFSSTINHNNDVEGESTADTTTTKTPRRRRTRIHPWRLSEEEQAIVEAHLWGAMRQSGSDK
ncbi:hypothetical protein BG015_001353 [Linnemannia schmuckeri]|uniref:Uncharacterized protein n=1 Tax=Linnemannia schmuckeri TaxID=64567 RepID=A0A9P5RTG1_9FUNG|nr:hypothetical protein BG015_001353 [Linnemannia schmuckeri]